MAPRIVLVGKVDPEAEEQLREMVQDRKEQEQQWALENLDFDDGDDFPFTSVYDVDQHDHVMEFFYRMHGRPARNYDEAEMFYMYGDEEDFDSSSHVFALDNGYPALADEL